MFIRFKESFVKFTSSIFSSRKKKQTEEAIQAELIIPIEEQQMNGDPQIKLPNIRPLPKYQDQETIHEVLPLKLLQFYDLTNQLIQSDYRLTIDRDIKFLFNKCEEQGNFSRQIDLQMQQKLDQKDIKNYQIYNQYIQIILPTFYSLSQIQKQFYFRLDYQFFQQLINIFRDNDISSQIVQHPQLQVSLNVKNFKTLKHGCWLNDEIVNGFINILNGQAEKGTLILKSFMMNLLIEQDEIKLMRISKKQNVNSNTKKIIIPINPRNTHWSVILIDRADRALIYYDSLGSIEGSVLQRIQYIVSIWDKEIPFSKKQDNYILTQGSSPKQNNSYDCGVFMLKNIQILSQNSTLDPRQFYSQELIFYDRLQIGVSLLKGQI